MLDELRKSEIINKCMGLIKIQSYSGNEKNVANKINDYFKELNFDDVTIDKYGNIIGHIKGKKSGKKLLFDGHMDTVPVTNKDKWVHAPFSAKIQDNKIYGRGTSDMKGALSAMICAVGYFAKDTNKDFCGDIYVCGVCHEECFEGVASREISKNINPDYVVIGEASQLNLKIGQRGRAEIVVETFGKPAHSANPEKGINAVYSMTKLIDEIRKIVPPTHEKLGKGILELTDIISSPYPGASVVPEYCRATYDRRLLVGETKQSVLKPIQDVIDKMEKENQDFKAKVSYAVGKETCYTGNTIEGERFFPAWIFNEKEDYIMSILNELNSSGFTPSITQYNFCTNGSHYAGEAGIKTIGIGPSRENLAHTVNEYIEINQLIDVTKCYYSVIKALLK